MSENSQIIVEKEKSDLLTFRNGNGNLTSSTNDTLHHFNLSFVQERRWFLEQMRPFNPPNTVKVIEIVGKLSIEILEAAFLKMFERHEALRTNISLFEGIPHGYLRSIEGFTISMIDLSTLDSFEKSTEISGIINEETQIELDLSKDLMLRANLIQIETNKFTLLLTFHIIVFDNPGFEIFLNELISIYDDLKNSRASKLPTEPLNYSSFSAQQRSLFDSGQVKKQIDHLLSELSSPLPILDLPSDRRRPAIQTFEGTNRRFKIDNEVYESLKKFCEESGFTVFLLLLTIFYILLYLYSGQEDLIVGIPSSHRSKWKEATVGCFTTFLSLRINQFSEFNVKQLLELVIDKYSRLADCIDVPYAKILDLLQLDRDLSRNPLFQVMFSAKEEQIKTIKGDDCNFEVAELEMTGAGVDLTLQFETKEEFALHWEYNTNLFDEETIERFNSHFVNILTDAIKNPEKPVSELKILSEIESEKILVKWNENNSIQPTYHCLHRHFERNAELFPDATAIIWEENVLTYRELNDEANKLSERLKKIGVKPEVFVGLCMDRSFGMIVGMLGVLKAGGAYVPLDPTYPLDRLSLIVEDAEVQIIVTKKELSEVIEFNNASLIFLDSDTEENKIKSGETDWNQPKPENAAYLIYTSGSTGKPKGVIIEHRNAEAFIQWSLNTFSKEQLSGVMASTSMCFDLSIFEVFVTLSAGGTIILAENALQLYSLPSADKVTLINTVPSAINELIRIGNLPPLAKTVNLAGEFLQIDLVNKIYEQPSVKEVYDLYGPSEDTTYSTFTLRRSNERATIGRPISNTQVYILNPRLKPVPIGVIGEIYIGGAGLSRGYWKRDELTKEKFISNPFGVSGSRLYKTGDKGCFLSDGRIEYHGRIDNQVKLRGYRIELNEIRSVLASHELVQDCVVIVREDFSGEQSLVAYLVTKNNKPIKVKEIKEFLKNKLPEYMIPTFIIVLDSLPLTPNGKLDRKLLPIPEFDREMGNSYIAPRNSSETKMVEIWEEILRHNPIGIHDNFFELGGTSLMAVRLFYLIEKNFNKKLPLSALFEAPTVEQLTKIVDDKVNYTWRSLIPINANGNRVPFFCVHAIGGNILTYKTLGPLLSSDQPVYGLQSVGLNGAESPKTSIEEMARHYIKEIKQIQPLGPYKIGGYSFGGIVAFEMAQQLLQANEQVALLALFDTSTSFHGREVITKMERSIQHLKNLKALSLSQKFEYLVKRTRNFKKKIIRRVKKSNKTDNKDNNSILSVIHDVREANYLALGKYDLTPYEGTITLFSSQDKQQSKDQNLPQDWNKFAVNRVVVHEIPGDHMQMFMEPFVRELALKLDQVLKEKD